MAPPAIPDRLLREIERQDAGAEIRISWVQLLLVAIFGVLYAFLPRAEGTEGFNYVPYALAGYALFSALRLSLAYLDRLKAPFLVLSVFVDIGLICGLIYSFHIQYGEPASFYLKAPTMLYIFLFIALRALRFDPRYVALTGIVGAIGWSALVIYAVAIDPEYPGRTRDFPMYISGNLVLFGAELDKVLVIAGVTFLTTYALVRARRVLINAIRDQAAVSNFSRFFSSDVATIVGSEDPEHLKAGYGIARKAAILMVDLRGFTALSETVAPEETVRILARYHAHLVPEIRKHGGAIDKFLGDGILATFGAVKPSNSAAADALRAVEGVLSKVDDLNRSLADDGFSVTLRVGCAAAYGDVVVGIVGDDARLEYTVIGRPVNTANKLEEHNKVLSSRAVTDDQTHAAALAQGYMQTEPIERVSGVQVSGLRGEQNLVVLARQALAIPPLPAEPVEAVPHRT